jgi:hypothetical protein
MYIVIKPVANKFIAIKTIVEIIKLVQPVCVPLKNQNMKQIATLQPNYKL